MFFRCRRCGFLARILMFILGIKWLTNRQYSAEDREVYRARARKFRQKLREAAAVWDDEPPEQSQDDNTVVDE